MTVIEVNALKGLAAFGQSPWLDSLRRSLITSGELRRLVEDDGLKGITTNPAIFEKAIAGSTEYEDVVQRLRTQGLDAAATYETIAIRDVQEAADIFRRVYDDTSGADGYVSLEVSPLLAHDAVATIDEARRLWTAVARPNVMVKVPATDAGIAAIRQLIVDDININVTLLFSRRTYERVVDAYLSALEQRAREGLAVDGVASVASFFISRIDSAVDDAIAERLAQTSDASDRERLFGLRGQVAIANAKLAYAHLTTILTSDRWQRLAALGAKPQRLLWASTSSKNPRYRDVKYVEELIGPDTVNTMPPATFDAFRDHGSLRHSLASDVARANEILRELDRAGIALDRITDRLLDDGLDQFVEAFRRLLDATGRVAPKINRQTFAAPTAVREAVAAALTRWNADDNTARLWRGDATLWTGSDEGRWLGWLHITADQLAHSEQIARIVRETHANGFRHVLLLGMGGSSLCPEVMRLTFGVVEGWPELHVLDSTDPAQIRATEARLDLAATLVVVSSKSGGTLEPNILKAYFFARVAAIVGDDEAPNRFIVITDPGSTLHRAAEHERLRHIVFGATTIGGRYSALSNFGLVPSALMGVDVPRLLHLTEEMVHACGSTVPVESNPAVQLGVFLGVSAIRGHDKITIVASPGIRSVGAWLEQLMGESTGKVGRGLIPVDQERIAAPGAYGSDRVFVYLRLESAPDVDQDERIAALEQAGHLVVRIALDSPHSLGEEFFRWEMAIAVAGSLIGVNPFDQPDVEASKIATRSLTEEYETRGTLPSETPRFASRGIALFADDRNAAALTGSRPDGTLADYLGAHLNRLRAGDYFALLAYIEANDAHWQLLQQIRHMVRDRVGVATCLGFGPRFLHSTGQVYKGGPDSGVFLQVTCDDAVDLPVPDRRYTFGTVKAAQARGDFAVLAARGRRALRVHVGADVRAGLTTLAASMRAARFQRR